MTQFAGLSLTIGAVSDITLRGFAGLQNMGVDPSEVYKELALEQLKDNKTKVRQLLDNNYYDQIVGNRAALRKPNRSIVVDVYLTDIEK